MKILRRLWLAWKFYRRLAYSWRTAWIVAERR
jgi:hypothetical protein